MGDTVATIVNEPCDEGVLRGAPTTAHACTRSAEPWVLAATILGSSMVFIDGTVTNVALPILQQELQATVVEVQWVVEAYALFLAALILPGGSLGDHFGRRRMFVLGVAIFASALSGATRATATRTAALAAPALLVWAAPLVWG